MLKEHDILEQHPAPAGARITSFLVNGVRLSYRIGQRVMPKSIDNLGLKELEQGLAQHYVASYVRKNSIAAAVSALPEPSWMPAELQDSHVIAKHQSGGEKLYVDNYTLWKTGESGMKIHLHAVFGDINSRGMHSRKEIDAAVAKLSPQEQAAVAEARQAYEQGENR